MIKYIYFLLIIFTGCELFVVGKKPEQVIDATRETPIGTVFLFKAELDSNNISAATRLLAETNGKPFLAEEKYEMYSDVERLRNKIYKKPITSYSKDSINEDSYKIYLEIDYIKNISFITQRIGNDWYIVNYKDEIQ